MHSSPGPRVRRSEWDKLSFSDRDSVIQIYLESFPPSERHSVSRLGRGDLSFWLALDSNDYVTGFCAAGHLAGICYMQYLAVSRLLRSSGIGASLLEAIARDLISDGQRAVVLEIEDPAHTDDALSAQRRKEFYARWGAEPFKCLTSYHIPNYADPASTVPMLLLWRPVIEQAVEPRGDHLRDLLRRLYEFEYAETAPAGYLSTVLSGVVC